VPSRLARSSLPKGRRTTVIGVGGLQAELAAQCVTVIVDQLEEARGHSLCRVPRRLPVDEAEFVDELAHDIGVTRLVILGHDAGEPWPVQCGDLEPSFIAHVEVRVVEPVPSHRHVGWRCHYRSFDEALRKISEALHLRSKLT
jgi:hypothetical protein